MRRFVEGMDRGQSTLFPECLEDWITEDNPARVIDVFVDELEHGKRVDLYLHQQGIDTSTPAGKALFQMRRVRARHDS